MSSSPLHADQPVRVPAPVARIAQLMSTFPAEWALCGGWAVDSWLGAETRVHHDLDIAVFHDDQRAIFDHLAGWNLVADVADDSIDPWDGRHIDLPAHLHARHDDGFDLEVIIIERSGRDWVLCHDPRLTLPLDQCVQLSAWGLATAAPEMLLFYKANLPNTWSNSQPKARRPHDELDFLALLPTLTEEQRHWLTSSISLMDSTHPWLSQLSAPRE